MTVRHVRIPTRLWEDARAVADDNDETVSDVIRRALTAYVKKGQK